MNTGALQVLPDRQLSTPLPNSPPMMNAAFFNSGMTTAHRALAQYSTGISERMSWTTRAAVASRAASLAVIAAALLSGVETVTTAASTNACFMKHLLPQARGVQRR